MHALLQSDCLRPQRAITHKRGYSTIPAAVVGLLSTFLFVADGYAFDELNDAQTLVYDQAHLAKTAVDDVLVYHYRATHGGAAEIDDEATLTVSAETDAERRDVTLDFLSDERAMNLPTFNGYRGNPVVIVMLEHLAQAMSAETGGGALYFRNRIRDGMAREDATVGRSVADFDGERIEIDTVTFHPFRDDAFLGNRPAYGDARFDIRFSEAVPGGVLAIVATSADADTTSDPEAAPARGKAPDDFHFELILTEPGR